MAVSGESIVETTQTIELAGQKWTYTKLPLSWRAEVFARIRQRKMEEYLAVAEKLRVSQADQNSYLSRLQSTPLRDGGLVNIESDLAVAGITEVLKKLGITKRQTTIRKAIQQVQLVGETKGEAEEFLDSEDGLQLIVGLSLKKHHSDVAESELPFTIEELAKLAELILVVSGLQDESEVDAEADYPTKSGSKEQGTSSDNGSEKKKKEKTSPCT